MEQAAIELIFTFQTIAFLLGIVRHALMALKEI